MENPGTGRKGCFEKKRERTMSCLYSEAITRSPSGIFSALVKSSERNLDGAYGSHFLLSTDSRVLPMNTF